MSGSSPSYLNSLNDRQREAVEIIDGPLIVLAGAGSGKTKMLTSRISSLIDQHHVPGHQILAVTFTNKAAAEMRDRVARALERPEIASANGFFGPGIGNPEIGTFHAICMRILRREQAFTPYTHSFVIYDDSDQLSLVKTVLQKLGIDDKAFNPKGLQGAINRHKCDATEAHEIVPAEHNLFDKVLKRVYEQYQKDLFANNAIDFGEIITLTYRLLRDNDGVRAKYQKRYAYLHVDEYQDTNRAQYLLLSQLAKAQFGGHGNICVVGDEDQSIYKWRGADIRNILDFEQDYPGAKIVKLEQNYRSTKTIIQAAGSVIKNNRERKDKTLWTDNERGLPITRAQLADERGEAEFVVGEIKRLARDDGRSYNDFAIFYRTHAQSRQFEDVLRRDKITYQVVGGLRFYDRKEIKDVLCYFRAIMNPTDSVSLKRIINTPARGIGKTTIDKLEEEQNRLSLEGAPNAHLWGTLKIALTGSEIVSGATAKKLGTFAALIERLIGDSSKLLLSELYHLILDETGYVRDLRMEGTEEALARVENLEEFDTLLNEFEEEFFESIPEAEREVRKKELLPLFIEQSTLASEGDRGDQTLPSLKMMSLHSSKGLEFPIVFLTGLEEGLFPSIRDWEEEADEDVEEERRLCYVGMTRARERLYMTHAVIRRIWGNISYQEPARFFKEIPSDCLEFRDMSYGGAASQYRAGSSRGFSFRESGQESVRASSTNAVREPARTPGRAQAPDDFSQLSPSDDDDDVIGRKLDHPEYGRGTVLSVEGSGPDTKILIEFKGRDRRKFLLRYVKSFFDI